MDYDLLQRIREYEMRQVLPLMTPGQTVLEIGAGAGWQSQMMVDYGMRVISVDLPTTNYLDVQDYSVIAYDGHNLPIQSHSIDVIFSSNVLEHIPHVDAIQAELHRVLKPGGKAIHVLPTTTWRLWTSLTHPLNFLISVLQRGGESHSVSDAGTTDVSPAPAAAPGIITKLRNALFAPRHGEIGTMFSELYLFNQVRWRRLFARTGWLVEAVYPNKLFYTGYILSRGFSTLQMRRWLSYVLGSSCQIYVLKAEAPS